MTLRDLGQENVRLAGFALPETHTDMSFVDRDYQQFVDLVYEAPLDGVTWVDALENLSRAIGAIGTVLITADKNFLIGRYVPEALRDYATAYGEYWWSQNFAGRRAISHKLSGIVAQVEACTTEEMSTSPFFQEFMRSYEVGGFHTFCDFGDGGAKLALCAKLPLSKAFLTEDEQQTFRRYIVHASRALRMTSRLETPLASTSLVEDALDVIATPAAIIGADKRVAFVNRSFEALDSCGLKIVDRRLFAPSPSQQGDLDRLIGDALAEPSMTSGSGVLTLRRAAGRPLVVQMASLPVNSRRTFGSLASQRRALALVTDPDAAYATGEAALIALGLTFTEAKFALLVGVGMSPCESAQRLGVSEATARTHLKRIFSKLGIERQSQLAILVAHLSKLA